MSGVSGIEASAAALTKSLAAREVALGRLGQALKAKLKDAVTVGELGEHGPRFLKVELPDFDGGSLPRIWHTRITDRDLTCFGPGSRRLMLDDWLKDLDRYLTDAAARAAHHAALLEGAAEAFEASESAKPDADGAQAGPRGRLSQLAERVEGA